MGSRGQSSRSRVEQDSRSIALNEHRLRRSWNLEVFHTALSRNGDATSASKFVVVVWVEGSMFTRNRAVAGVLAAGKIICCQRLPGLVAFVACGGLVFGESTQ